MVITLTNISKAFNERKLLDNISLTIEEKEKIGIIGVNGSGKTTLLNIIGEKLEPDTGDIVKAKDLRISYLWQNSFYDDNLTILEYVYKNINKDDADDYEAKAILSKLGFENYDEKLGNLSIGKKKIVSLGAALISPSDLLLLDEPTNNLDIETTTWLEKYLSKYNGAIIMVTHDRYFLERIVNEIWEVEQGKIFEYEANYSLYLSQKVERYEELLASERKRQAFLRKEIEWVRRGVQARETKSKKRLENYEKIKNKKIIVDEKKLETFGISSRLGKKIVEIKNASVKYNNTIFENFNLILDRESRYGIVGSNGSGKTTILKTIMGMTTLSSGTVDIGTTVRFGYFSTSFENMDFEKRVVDYIEDITSNVTIEKRVYTATQMLEKFLFTEEMQYTPIKKLSGGEKRRLYLLGVLMTAPNVLLLDEVTNDLDIPTLSILEEYLETFDGAVVAVSHDRYFLDNFAENILHIEDGKIKEYLGGYTDFSLKYEPKTSSKKEEPKAKRVKEKIVKLTFKEEQEFAVIEDEIMEIENEINNLNIFISENYSDYDKIKYKLLEKKELELKLEEKMDRWEYLNEIKEKMDKN